MKGKKMNRYEIYVKTNIEDAVVDVYAESFEEAKDKLPEALDEYNISGSPEFIDLRSTKEWVQEPNKRCNKTIDMFREKS